MTYDTESDLEVEAINSKDGNGATVLGEKAPSSKES